MGNTALLRSDFHFYPVFLPVYNQSNNQLTIRLTACDPLMINITIAEEFVSVCVRQRRKRRRIQAPTRRDCIREPRRLGSQSIECERRISAAPFTFWSLKRFLLEKPPPKTRLSRFDQRSYSQHGTTWQRADTGKRLRTDKTHKISGLIWSESSVCSGMVHAVEGESMTPARKTRRTHVCQIPAKTFSHFAEFSYLATESWGS